MKSIVFFFFCLLSVLSHSQEYSFISKEYHKLSDTEIAIIVEEKRVFKPISYLEDGTQITDSIAISLGLNKNAYKYKQFLYGDSEGNLKLLVLKLYTEDELKQRNKSLNDKINLSKKVLKEYKGEKAPDFNFIDLQGNSYNIESLKGKIVVINFWFIKCSACLKEMPDLNKMVDKYKDKPVVFLAVTFDQADKVTEFLTKKEIKLNVIPNERKTITNFKIQFFPTNIIINKEGDVAYAQDGFTKDMIKVMNKTIDKLLD